MKRLLVEAKGLKAPDLVVLSEKVETLSAEPEPPLPSEELIPLRVPPSPVTRPKVMPLKVVVPKTISPEVESPKAHLKAWTPEPVPRIEIQASDDRFWEMFFYGLGTALFLLLLFILIRRKRREREKRPIAEPVFFANHISVEEEPMFAESQPRMKKTQKISISPKSIKKSGKEKLSPRDRLSKKKKSKIIREVKKA